MNIEIFCLLGKCCNFNQIEYVQNLKLSQFLSNGAILNFYLSNTVKEWNEKSRSRLNAKTN